MIVLDSKELVILTPPHTASGNLHRDGMPEMLTRGSALEANSPFEQADILKRSNFESGKAIYELNEGEHHDHLVCLDCGKVEEFFDAEIEKRQHDIAKEKGFILADHGLSLYAHCTKPNCPDRGQKISHA